MPPLPQIYVDQILAILRAAVRPEVEILNSSKRSLVLRISHNGVPNSILGYPFWFSRGSFSRGSWWSRNKPPAVTSQHVANSLKDSLVMCTKLINDDFGAVWREEMRAPVTVDVRYDDARVEADIIDSTGKTVRLIPVIMR